MEMTRSAVPTFVRTLPLTREALASAARLHDGQRREVDGAPFLIHPLEVASLLYNTGHADIVVASGVLHDAVEDTPVDVNDIGSRFGEEVCALVAAMTEDPAIDDYVERKAALRRQIADAAPEAAAIYAADKVTKVRELRAQAAQDREMLDASTKKLDHYTASLEMLEEIARDHPLVRQLRFELEMLRALPPAAAEPTALAG